jgi:predicted DNA-binding protein (MmcQ/YjbR family)
MSMDATADRLRAAALAYPEAEEHFPWGESAFKVRGKVFLFMNRGDAALTLSMKLPANRDFALVFDWAQPTGYGLGKSGWVTCRLEPGGDADLELIEGWLAESYRAVAPKKLAALLPA